MRAEYKDGGSVFLNVYAETIDKLIEPAIGVEKRYIAQRNNGQEQKYCIIFPEFMRRTENIISIKRVAEDSLYLCLPPQFRDSEKMRELSEFVFPLTLGDFKIANLEKRSGEIPENSLVINVLS